MVLYTNLEPVVQYLFIPIIYIFAHLSDQKIKEFITAANQEDLAVETAV